MHGCSRAMYLVPSRWTACDICTYVCMYVSSELDSTGCMHITCCVPLPLWSYSEGTRTYHKQLVTSQTDSMGYITWSHISGWYYVGNACTPLCVVNDKDLVTSRTGSPSGWYHTFLCDHIAYSASQINIHPHNACMHVYNNIVHRCYCIILYVWTY